jgi:hypothetical protein
MPEVMVIYTGCPDDTFLPLTNKKGKVVDAKRGEIVDVELTPRIKELLKRGVLRFVKEEETIE